MNKRINKTLDFAESSLPESQFKAFRKLFLNEFGDSGLLMDLKGLSTKGQERHGMGGNILREGGGENG
ncbi:MAG: hypothetical protein OEV92_00690 [Nitrospinota bacterium]|nr:hypothetical protein [Nitrospinota bacterium]